MDITIIGTGYVGLVSGTCFAEMGYGVICIDNNPQKLEKLRNADIPIYEPGLEILFYRNIAKKRLFFSDDLNAAVNKSDPAANETAIFYFKDTISTMEDQYLALRNADALLILTE